MNIIIWIVALFLVFLFLFSGEMGITRVHRGPAYIDDPKAFLDKQILYSEWDQKLNSVVI